MQEVAGFGKTKSAIAGASNLHQELAVPVERWRLVDVSATNSPAISINAALFLPMNSVSGSGEAVSIPACLGTVRLDAQVEQIKSVVMVEHPGIPHALLLREVDHGAGLLDR